MGRAEKYVDEGKIKWGLLATTSGASLILLVFRGIQDQITTVAAGIAYMFGAAQRAIGNILGSLFGIPAGILESGAAETIAWLPLFGPFALPVGIGITMLAVWIGTRVVSGG